MGIKDKADRVARAAVTPERLAWKAQAALAQRRLEKSQAQAKKEGKR